MYLSRPRPEDQDEAQRLFHKALRIEPGMAAAHAGLARSSAYLYTLGIDPSPKRLEAAIENARRAVELAPGSAGAHAALATALIAADQLTPALEESRNATRIDPSDHTGHLATCTVLRLQQDFDAALEACRRAAAIAPHAAGVLTGLAAVLAELELYGGALELYGQAIDLDHEAIVPQLGAAGTLARARSTSRARYAYNTLLENWDYAVDRTLLGAAGLLVISRRHESALEMYSRIDIQDDATLPTILALYGKGYCLKKLDRDAEAEYFLSMLIDRVPVEYDGPARGREFLFRAYDDLIRYFGEKERERKVVSLLRSATGRPMVPARLALRLAELEEGRNRPEEAALVLESMLLAPDPGDDPLEVGRAALLLARIRTSDGRRSVSGDSDTSRALSRAAGMIEESSLGVAHYRLARAQALMRDPASALASLARARTNGYLPLDRLGEEADFEAIRNEADFQRLLGD